MGGRSVVPRMKFVSLFFDRPSSIFNHFAEIPFVPHRIGRRFGDSENALPLRIEDSEPKLIAVIKELSAALKGLKGLFYDFLDLFV